MPRAFDLTALLFTVMAGVTSVDSTLPLWAVLPIILVTAVVPYQVAAAVMKRRGGGVS